MNHVNGAKKQSVSAQKRDVATRS